MSVASETERPHTRLAERERLVRRAKALAWSSLAWMTVEGVIAVLAGVMANSIALIGFSIDRVTRTVDIIR